jgi:hypothetical protein
MWLIIDGCNLTTAHVITTCRDADSKKYYPFSNSDVTQYDSEDDCIDAFSKQAIVATGIYKNLMKYPFHA